MRAELEEQLRREVARRRKAESRLEEIRSLTSHQLRTPLVSLVGLTELMLQREYPAEKQRHFLEILNREAGRLSDLVGDFLEDLRT